MKKLFISILAALLIAGSTAGRGEMATHITTLAGLQNMNLDLTEDYILDNDIDASATSGWNAGLGFDPIGDPLAVGFTGSFDGQGYTISNLYINRPGEYVGLFGEVEKTVTIRNVTLRDVNIRGGDDGLGYSLGGLVAYYGQVAAAPSGVVSNCHVTGNVRGGATGAMFAGGLIGFCGRVAISRCSFEGTLEGTSGAGGLIGRGYLTTLHQSYAEANVNHIGPGFSAGGLIGNTYGNCAITQSFALGNVGGIAGSIGGLVGDLRLTTVANSYSRSAVSGTVTQAGGLVGNLRADASVDRSYSTGLVNPVGIAGGLIGTNLGAGNVTLSFWDTETSGQAASAGGTGRTTDQMNTESTFTDVGWDFTTIWSICFPPTPAYPWLRWEGIACGGVTISLIG